MHPAVSIKVNAWVDEKIAPLVTALNRFSCIQTVDSCQGGAGKPAHVMFRHVGRAADRASFFHQFGKSLSEKVPASCGYDFRLQWLTGHDEPLAELWTEPANIKPLATAIASMVRANDRRNQSPHGKRGTAPRSSTNRRAS